MTEPDWDDEPFDLGLHELELLSNSVIDLIEQGRFDDADLVCLELGRRYPDQIDSLSRSAEVHEARGQAAEAAELYQRCLEFIEEHPGGFDEESKEWYRERMSRSTSGRTR
jgi:hypothetical protein